MAMGVDFLSLFCVLSITAAKHVPVSNPTSFFYTPLDNYVAREDSHYRYENQNISFSGTGWTGRTYKMWSQQWLTPDVWWTPGGAANDSVWVHYMTILTPDKLDPAHTDKAFVYVTGGSNLDGPPTNRQENAFIGSLAAQLGVIGAVLFQVPNQPIVFAEDPTRQPRTEDAYIAWTWNHYVFNPSDEDWPARLPMTKSVVRAFDTVSAVVPSVNKFIVGGGSKRGWTSWTTALTDARVIGVVPIVMDLLHMIHNLHHMWRAYHGWTGQFYDYYKEDMTKYLDLPGYQWLARIEDPYYYFPDEDRLRMPKLVVSAANDEFFQPDNDIYWWPYLREPKHRLIVPNSGHGINPAAMINTLVAWIQTEVYQYAAPSYSWTIDKDTGTITVVNDPTHFKPLSVSLWSAPSYAPTGLRDWRANGGWPTRPQNVTYVQEVLTENPANTWVAAKPRPLTGWTAFFVELVYEIPPPFGSPSRVQFKLTTQVSVVPRDEWVTDDCINYECYGTLV